jgi:hypothetical protein
MSYFVNIINDTGGLQDFLGVPNLVYQNDPKWVSPLHSEIIRTLDSQKNPYFKNADIQKYVCYKDGKPIARSITVINQNHWLKFGTKTGFFGFFESLNDQEAVTSLFHTMSEYCRKMGCEILEGPFNPNHYSELGLLIKNFTEPVFFETYNPEYYPTLLAGAGFKMENTLHTRLNREARKYIHEKPINDLSKAKDKGFRIRPFSLVHMKRDLECIREVYNDAFSANWHFLSLTEDEYSFSAKSLFLVTKPELIQIVEHHGKPVGVLQCMPNVNPSLKKMKGSPNILDMLRFLWQRFFIKEIVIYAIGIKKSYQNGIVFLLLNEALRRMVHTYPVLYTTWMTESNITAVRASETFGLKPYKWFGIYSKSLHNDNQ